MKAIETTADLAMEATVTTLQTVDGDDRNYCRFGYGGYCNDPVNCGLWRL